MIQRQPHVHRVTAALAAVGHRPSGVRGGSCAVVTTTQLLSLAVVRHATSAAPSCSTGALNTEISYPVSDTSSISSAPLPVPQSFILGPVVPTYQHEVDSWRSVKDLLREMPEAVELHDLPIPKARLPASCRSTSMPVDGTPTTERKGCAEPSDRGISAHNRRPFRMTKALSQGEFLSHIAEALSVEDDPTHNPASRQHDADDLIVNMSLWLALHRCCSTNEFLSYTANKGLSALFNSLLGDGVVATSVRRRRFRAAFGLYEALSRFGLSLGPRTISKLFANSMYDATDASDGAHAGFVETPDFSTNPPKVPRAAPRHPQQLPPVPPVPPPPNTTSTVGQEKMASEGLVVSQGAALPPARHAFRIPTALTYSETARAVPRAIAFEMAVGALDPLKFYRGLGCAVSARQHPQMERLPRMGDTSTHDDDVAASGLAVTRNLNPIVQQRGTPLASADRTTPNTLPRIPSSSCPPHVLDNADVAKGSSVIRTFTGDLHRHSTTSAGASEARAAPRLTGKEEAAFLISLQSLVSTSESRVGSHSRHHTTRRLDRVVVDQVTGDAVSAGWDRALFLWREHYLAAPLQAQTMPLAPDVPVPRLTVLPPTLREDRCSRRAVECLMTVLMSMPTHFPARDPENCVEGSVSTAGLSLAFLASLRAHHNRSLIPPSPSERKGEGGRLSSWISVEACVSGAQLCMNNGRMWKLALQWASSGVEVVESAHATLDGSPHFPPRLTDIFPPAPRPPTDERSVDGTAPASYPRVADAVRKLYKVALVAAHKGKQRDLEKQLREALGEERDEGRSGRGTLPFSSGVKSTRTYSNNPSRRRQQN